MLLKIVYRRHPRTKHKTTLTAEDAEDAEEPKLNANEDQAANTDT